MRVALIAEAMAGRKLVDSLLRKKDERRKRSISFPAQLSSSEAALIVLLPATMSEQS